MKKPAKHKFNILEKVCEYIPRNCDPKLSKLHNIRTRSFLLLESHCCLDILSAFTQFKLKRYQWLFAQSWSFLQSIHGDSAPRWNGLSCADLTRNADLAAELSWLVLTYLQSMSWGFGFGRNYQGLTRRFKKMIYAVDSITIKLIANCFHYAKHRRRKAAAKWHMRLNLQTLSAIFCHSKVCRDSWIN